MKKLLFSLLGLILCSTMIQAQPDTDYTNSADSDPAAKAVLERVKATYDSYTSLQADFNLVIEFPEEPVTNQSGKLFQQGDKYRIELESQSIICDGSTVWLYLSANQEVQINDADFGEEEGILTPSDLLQVYESEDYVYVLSNELMEEGRAVQQIEFKPIDRDSEYSKMRLTVDKRTAQVKRIKAFSRDGSRFTLVLNTVTPNQSIPESKFVWNTSECPECYVEDLRID